MQTSAHWYLWHTDERLRIPPRKRRFIFWVFLTSTHLFYQHETILVGYFWIVTNTFNIYFWEVSETSQNKHLFWDMFETSFLRRLKNVKWKTSFLRCIWDVLKTSQKRRLFWDLSETSWRCHKKGIFFEMS